MIPALYHDIFNPSTSTSTGKFAIIVNGHQTECKFHLTRIEKIASLFRKNLNWIPCHLNIRSSHGICSRKVYAVFIKKTRAFFPERDAIYTPSAYPQKPISLVPRYERNVLVTSGHTTTQFILYGEGAFKIAQEQFVAALEALKKLSFKSIRLYNINGYFVVSWSKEVVLVVDKIIKKERKNIYFVYKILKESEFYFKVKRKVLKQPNEEHKAVLSFTFPLETLEIASSKNRRFGIYKPKNVKEAQIDLPENYLKKSSVSSYYVCLKKQGIDLILGTPHIKTIEKLKKIFLDLLTGLYQIHSAGCLHRNLEGGNFILYPKKTLIENMEYAGPIRLGKISQMPSQTIRMMDLVFKKKLMQTWGIECTNRIENEDYRILWTRRGIPRIIYRESFELERNVMGFALAEIYLNFVAKFRMREAKLEYIISNFLRYNLEKEDEDEKAEEVKQEPFSKTRAGAKPLFSDFSSLLHAINNDLKAKSLEDVKRMTAHSMRLAEAIELLLT
jgi:hypothetical protein